MNSEQYLFHKETLKTLGTTIMSLYINPNI